MNYASIRNFVPLLALAAVVFSCGRQADPEKKANAVYQFNPPATYPEFSGERAIELAAAQVAFGPRVPNSPAHDSCLAFMHTFLSNLAPRVKMQDFVLPGYDGAQLRLANIIAKFNPDSKVRIVLAAHWDSRPRADMEKDEAKKASPIPGANDGASGVAVLMHLAELFAKTPPPVGVDLVLFDGEDYGKEGDEAFYCLGAKYFSSTIAPDYNPVFGILLDLVGDKDAVFYREGYSDRLAGDIVDLLWANAHKLGLKEFRNRAADAILDDHVSMNLTAGIKTVNIIDMDLIGHKDPSERRKYWHTHKDTMENLSPATLGNVGTLLAYTIYGLSPAKQ